MNLNENVVRDYLQWVDKTYDHSIEQSLILVEDEFLLINIVGRFRLDSRIKNRTCPVKIKSISSICREYIHRDIDIDTATKKIMMMAKKLSGEVK